MKERYEPGPAVENDQASKAFIELVKAMARRQARLDLLPPLSVNDNARTNDPRGKA